jgi:hypothetical protein
MAPRKQKRRPSYAWALHYQHSDPELRGANRDVLDGLAYAQELAANHQQRARYALEGPAAPNRITVEDLAAWNSASPVTIHTKIKNARTHIFGKDLKPSAIYTRLKNRPQHQNRSCAHPDCPRPIAPQEPLSRLYCTEHRQPRHRTQRHRHHQRQQKAISLP